MPISQYFPGRRLTVYFATCCLRVHLQGSSFTHVGAGCDPPWHLEQLVSMYATFFPPTSSNCKTCCQSVSRRRLYTCLAPHLLLMLLKGQLNLIANWACIHKPHRTVPNSEVVLNWQCMRVLATAIPPELSVKETSKLPSSQFFLKWV